MLNTNNIINNMLNSSLSNCVLFKVKEGKLIIENDTNIYVISDSKAYYLTHSPYDIDGENIDKRIRKRIANEFIEKYNYDDIVKIYEGKQREKREKAEKAEKNKPQLIHLMEKYEILKQYGEMEIFANDNIIEYYIEFKRNYNYRLEIYLGADGIYNIRYNYENKKVNTEELDELITIMINSIKEEIEEEKRKVEKEKEEKRQEQNKEEFARKTLKGEIAIIKLKTSYQCLRNGMRYTVGKGEGKFYELNSVYDIVKYLNKKEISEYVFISEEELKGIKLKQLKELTYKKF